MRPAVHQSNTRFITCRCADRPQLLRSPAPVMLFRPAVGAKCEAPHYKCPLYRTTERRGVLATTGHSTNFVMDLQVPSSKPQDEWVRAGVAFVLSLPQ